MHFSGELIALYGTGLIAQSYKNKAVFTPTKKASLAAGETLLKGTGLTLATAGLLSGDAQKLALASGAALTLSKATYDGAKRWRSL